MFERFSAQARAVLERAQREARELQHNYIGTEHLLIGLEGTSADHVLTALGCTPADRRQGVIELVGRGPAPLQGAPAFTPRAKKVLELSLREALAREERSIRPEHVLLALLREGEGVAAQVLTDAGLSYDIVQTPLGVAPPRRSARRMRFGRGALLDPLPGGVPAGPATPAGSRIPIMARAAAGSDPLGTHHYLMAILDEQHGLAAKVLDALGVTQEAVEQKAEELGTAGTSDEPVKVEVDVGGKRFVLPADEAARLQELLEQGPNETRRRLLGGDEPAA